MIKNNTKYAILGILCIKPSSGYDIKKYCDTVLANFWSENYGHIYPVLKQLLEEKCIGEKQQEDEKKKVYIITPKGKDEYHEWLEKAPSYGPVRSEFLLKLIFSSELPKEKTLDMLEEYQTRQWNKLEELKKRKKELENNKQSFSPDRIKYINAVLSYGIHTTKATIAWCQETIKYI